MTVLNPNQEDQHATHVPIRYAVAGPAVRINLADKESLKNGVVLQMGVSTALPQSDVSNEQRHTYCEYLNYHLTDLLCF